VQAERKYFLNHVVDKGLFSEYIKIIRRQQQKEKYPIKMDE
jgi:hypothetical protein